MMGVPSEKFDEALREALDAIDRMFDHINWTFEPRTAGHVAELMASAQVDLERVRDIRRPA
jgi:hypothetical protein